MTSLAARRPALPARPRRRGGSQRPRGPGLLQIGLSLGIALLLVAVTLTTRQPPPPAIAELAPQAAETIKEQPKEQASQFGSGAGPGDCPPGAACAAGEGAGSGAGGGDAGDGDGGPPTSTAAPVIGPANLKRCVGDPPRQIEDPQSPPCIAYWDDSKGNGGATWPGVTKDEILIAAPEMSDTLYPALQNFFNNRFQFYGRRIRLVKPNGRGTAGADDTKQRGAFAALTSFNDGPYYRRLAQHKIIGVYRTPDMSDSELAASSPYMWGYTMSFTQMMMSLADWACHRLVGQKARHAGQIDLRSLADSERTFAIFLDVGTPDSTVRYDVLKSGLEQCGAKVAFHTTYPRGQNTDPIRIRNEIASLKEAGVTTVICLCPSNNMVALQAQADTQRYEPEWVITSYPQLVQPEGWKTASQNHRMFGLSFGPMDRVREDHPVTWALREGDPSGVAVATSNIGNDDQHYRGFLMLASGLQMAGPNLTPETFLTGLRKARFPNPDHPIMAGTVGFEGDFSMTNDAAEFWWGENEQNPYNDEPGAFCWVDGGRRHARGTWTKSEDPFFKGPCDAGTRPVS